MTTASAIQLASTFDCTLLCKPLQRALSGAGITQEIRVTPPPQLRDHMLTPSGDSEDILGTVVLVRLEDWLREQADSLPPAGADAVARQYLRQHTEEFLSHLAVLALRGRPVWLLVSPSNGWIAGQFKLATLCRTMGNLFAARVRNVGGVELLPWPPTLSGNEFCDQESDRSSHVPFTAAGFELLSGALADNLARSLAAHDPNAANTATGSPELAAFLAGLHVTVTLSPASPSDQADVGRILRTAASFSLVGENPTMSEAEAEAIVASGSCHIVRVSDRISQYGTAGVVLLSQDGDKLVVGAMSLSCTVLGKQVEYALLSALRQFASARRLAKLVFDYHASGRNQPMLAFLNAVSGTDSGSDFTVPVGEVEQRIQQSAIAPEAWTVHLV